MCDVYLLQKKSNWEGGSEQALGKKKEYIPFPKGQVLLTILSSFHGKGVCECLPKLTSMVCHSSAASFKKLKCNI